MGLDDTSNDREAHSKSTVRLVAAIEPFKHGFTFRHRNARAFILDRETHGTVVADRSYVDRSSRRRVLRCIFYKVINDLDQSPRVG